MDKINSRVFSTSFSSFDFLNLGYQPKLFVNVPIQTNIKGEFIYFR